MLPLPPMVTTLLLLLPLALVVAVGADDVDRAAIRVDGADACCCIRVEGPDNVDELDNVEETEEDEEEEVADEEGRG